MRTSGRVGMGCKGSGRNCGRGSEEKYRTQKVG